MIPLKVQAINTALVGDWKKAVFLNQALLKETPGDIETLNRLAFAFSVLGRTRMAKLTYQKVLEIDSQNPIALRNLKRLSGVKLTVKKAKDLEDLLMQRQPLAIFLEEHGKTKVIELLNVAQHQTISRLIIGEPIQLRIKRSKIFVLNGNGQYIGMLPDDISRRLITFIKAGSQYQSCIKSLENRSVSIFIRETKRSSRFKNQPSFVVNERIKMRVGKAGTQVSVEIEESFEVEA